MDFDFPEVLGFRPQQTTKFFRTLIVAEALHLKHLSQCNIAPLLSKSAVRAKPPRLLRKLLCQALHSKVSQRLTFLQLPQEDLLRYVARCCTKLGDARKSARV